jgi:serine/threonine protein phosphatase PrpC
MADKGLTLVMVARTDVGQEREINEDNFLVSADYRNADWFLPAEPYTALDSIMVVADGMGGLNAGEVASRITVDSIKDFLRNYSKPPSSDEAIRTMLNKSIQFAHKQVVAHSKEHNETEGMGSTIVVGLIANQKIHFSWSGDSRGYVYRQGRLQQLTKDHSYVQTLVNEGKLTAEQAHLHPESNVILQSIGDVERAPRPDYVSLPLCNEDIILMCTDGVNSMIPDAAIEGLITGCVANLSVCAEQIVAAANAAGGVDNITLLMTKVMGGGVEKAPAAEGIDVTTLNPFETNTLPNRKKRGKGRLGILLAALVLVTTGFFVMPMFHKPVPETKQVVKKDSTVKKDSAVTKKDSVIKQDTMFKKPAAVRPKPPKKIVQPENELTPVVDTTKK